MNLVRLYSSFQTVAPRPQQPPQPLQQQQQQQPQRMVGMDEMPLQVRKADTKFVLRKVGQDPSWRARLGNLMSENR